MKHFAGILFSDCYSELSNELIGRRTLASIPFAGRFRIIDFMLSSLVDAGVENVAVIPRKNFSSLEDHLGGGRHWDLNHRNSGLKILSPFFKADNTNEVFMARGKLDALRSVALHIERLREEYVVLCSGNIVANINFSDVFKTHIDSGADITAVYANIENPSPLSLKVDIDGTRANAFSYADENKGAQNVALGIYVMKRELLIDIIKKANEQDLSNFESHVLIRNTDGLDIRAYKHGDFTRIIYTVSDYYNASMDMLDIEKRTQVFNPKRPITTKVKDSVPTLYRYNANIENSLIADGCNIDGTVKNSIIFRNVTIETGAVIENSIVMQNTVIGKNCVLNNVVADKDVAVSEGKELRGAENYPYVLIKGTKI